MQEDHRWFGAGRSGDLDAVRAAEGAVQAALRGRSAKLIVLFASETLDLPELVERAYELGQGAELVGCSTAGEIAAGGPSDASVVALALGGDGLEIATTRVENLGSAPREAGAAAAAPLGQIADTPYRVLMLLTDGLSGDQMAVVRGAHSIVGSGVPLVGGCAGDDMKMSATYQFFGGSVLRDAVVSAAIGSDGPLGIGVRHGRTSIGEAMLVTDSTPTRVNTLDDQPALDVYLDRLNAPPDARADREAFRRFALGHPLGMARRAGEEQVRTIPAADFERRALVTVAEIPPGAIVRLMTGDVDSALAATDAACADALAPLDGAQPRGLIVFDCAARRTLLGDAGIRKEIERVESHAAGAPVAGFYTYGEIARTHGGSGLHNETLVVLAVG